MDSDSDDLYDPVDATPGILQTNSEPRHNEFNTEEVEDGEEEGEEIEEEDSDDDDINFITDAQEEPKAESTSQSKRQPSSAHPILDPRKVSATPTPALRSEISDYDSISRTTQERPGTDYPAHHTSTIDPNGNPIHPMSNKPILSTDFDSDFPTESTKPWRKPGSDITDYFNYGFDEFTWASYCLKQEQMPKEIAEIKSQAEYMKAFVEGIPGGAAAPPGMPGIPGAPTGLGAGVAAGAAGAPANEAMPAMPGMPSEAEMQQMFAGMMAQGMDPSAMDANQFMQMMMGGAAGAAGGVQPGFGGQGGGQAFGGAQATGQQQMGFGGAGAFDQGSSFGGGGASGGGSGGGGSVGAGRGRGRAGRRNWG